MHGYYWNMAIPEADLDWLHITVLETLARGFDCIIMDQIVPPTARLHKLAKRPPPDGTTLCWSLDALPAGVLADGDPRKRAARDEHRRKRPRDDAGGRGGKGRR